MLQYRLITNDDYSCGTSTGLLVMRTRAPGGCQFLGMARTLSL